MTVVGRFAPSPSGDMHAGNIFASLMAWLIAKGQGGRMVLRIEDLDRARSKQHFANKIMRDYEKLGLYWDDGPYYQSDTQRYDTFYDALESLGLTYPCFCTRADLHAAAAPHAGEQFVYPGTCRALTPEERRARMEEEAKTRYAIRLATPDAPVSFSDAICGDMCFNVGSDCGDFVVRRTDGSYAYQLAVVVDDALEGVNSVVRGNDLLSSTPQQIYLQQLLGFSTPSYAHVPLFVDTSGRRLSKRNRDAEIDELIAQWGSPRAVIGAIAHKAGLISHYEPLTPEELLTRDDLSLYDVGVHPIVWA